MASPGQPNGVHTSPPPRAVTAAAESTTADHNHAAANNSTTTAAAAATTRVEMPPDAPRTSLQDTDDAKRPREARLIHLVLATMGINSYQERVPLQLLDFAYRYTSSVLSDSLRLSGEGYAGASEPRGRGRGGGGGGGGGGSGAANGGAGAGGAGAEPGSEGITVQSLRQAIASRQGFTFAGHLPKEWMLEQAEQHNKVALPKIEARGYGLQLPPEQYCLNGVGWGLKEEWSDEEDVVDDEEAGDTASPSGHREDARMGGVNDGDDDDAEDRDEDEDEEGGGRMEDVFGEEGGGDTSMTGQE